MRPQLRACLLIVTGLLMVGAPWEADAAGSRSVRVSPEALPSWWNGPDTVVIDVRPGASYRAGHIPAAISLSHWDSASGVELVTEQLGQMGISGEETLVLYGDEDSYESLAELFWWLERVGCREVWILEGGIRHWQLGGKALEREQRVRPPVEFSRSPSEKPVAELRWVLDHFGTEGTEIIDVRGSLVGDLHRFPPLFHEGHIPHSLPYDFSRLHGEHGVWLADGESARKKFERLGPRPQDHVRLDAVFVLYGDNAEDLRSKVGYLILRMLGVRVKIYPGGWEEWSRYPNPVVKILGAEELHEWLNQEPGLTLFDLRIQRDYDIGHIPGALSFPAYQSQDRLVSFLQGEDAPDADEPLVFYCYGVECIRSRNSSTLAARLGFRNLYWFRKGYPGWQAAGFPVVRKSTGPKQ